MLIVDKHWGQCYKIGHSYKFVIYMNELIGTAPQIIERVSRESGLAAADIQDWFEKTLGANWETLVAGGMWLTLMATDIVSVASDVLKDGKINVSDWKQIPRGLIRLVGSYGGSMVMREALLRNPLVVLATAAATVVTSVGVASVVEQGKKVAKTPKGQEFRIFLKSSVGALLAGATGGAVELMAAKVDPDAWALTNLSLALVAATRPREFAALVEQVRKSL